MCGPVTTSLVIVWLYANALRQSEIQYDITTVVTGNKVPFPHTSKQNVTTVDYLCFLFTVEPLLSGWSGTYYSLYLRNVRN